VAEKKTKCVQGRGTQGNPGGKGVGTFSRNTPKKNEKKLGVGEKFGGAPVEVLGGAVVTFPVTVDAVANKTGNGQTKNWAPKLGPGGKSSLRTRGVWRRRKRETNPTGQRRGDVALAWHWALDE